jgi:hypothetical protein
VAVFEATDFAVREASDLPVLQFPGSLGKNDPIHMPQANNGDICQFRIAYQ